MSSKQALGYDPPPSARAFTYPAVAPANSGDATPTTSSIPGNRLWSASTEFASEAEAGRTEQRERKIRERALEEGTARARAEFEKDLAARREQIGKAVAEFAAQRDTYFRRVEEQVVRLALAIARKILHREAQIDPLLLNGVVRVALEKLGAGTAARLKANPADLPVWRDYFTQAREDLTPPELIGDSELAPGHCLLETDLGSTEISLEMQLKEIEQGFFDLLAQRPGAPAGMSTETV